MTNIQLPFSEQFATYGLAFEIDAARGGVAVAGRAVMPADSPGEAIGILGETEGGIGVMGRPVADSATGVGVLGVGGRGGIGVQGRGGEFAGRFDGDVLITGTMTANVDIVLQGADCAEDFDVDGDAPAGTVMVLTGDGRLGPSTAAYDRRVAGIVSGAGAYRPGMILDRHADRNQRAPIALMGKAYCFVDARMASVDVGDLLTTSITPGHAMKAIEPRRCFGAVLGKALAPLDRGRALIPVLVALQ